MQKQTKFKHGVSENGELQVYRVDEILDDKNEVTTEKVHQPYSPKDPKNMEDFDPKSVEIVAAITAPETLVAFVGQSFNELKVHVEEMQTIVGGIHPQKVVSYDRMVDDLNRIAVRRITRFYDDGTEIGKKYHRSWIMPGDDPIKADVISKALAVKLHTPEVVTAYKAKMAEQANGL